MHGLVFPQTNITMKPQVLHTALGKLRNFFMKTDKYGKCSITVSAVELWNKIQKQIKSILPKDLYPPIKLKQLPVIFILNQIIISHLI